MDKLWKLLITTIIIAILCILVAVRFFGYNKFQEVELEKDKLQNQQKENGESDSQSSSETVNNNQEQTTIEEDQKKVNRNNVLIIYSLDWNKAMKIGLIRVK
ncbi:hypothetical protein [Staphylococcus sp. AS1337]|uniref:hypothetical protein n=1 Tax=Staphylococcus sp. AS1337 TaxID=3434042 RepID=UPI003F56EC72